MALGYTSGDTPDTGWWMEQITKAREFRAYHARQQQWRTWRSYYRARFDRRQLPVNLFFAMLRSTVPRVYFRNPSVSVSPGMPGFMNMAFALILNRIDHKMLRHMRVKNEVKDIVQDAFIFGTGVGKMGYGAQFNFGGQDNSAPLGKGKARRRVEYDHFIQENMPWFLRVPTGRFLVPAATCRQREARWVAHEIIRSKDDVKADSRLSNTESLTPIRNLSERKFFGGGGEDSQIEYPYDAIEMVEIYDRQRDRVIVLSPNSAENGGQVLYNEVTEFERPPFFSVVFNPDDEVFWGIPDAANLEPHQLEINEINTQAMKHRRLAIIKLLIGPDAMEDEEISKMTSEDVAAIVRTKVDPNTAIAKFQVADIPQSLIPAEREVMMNVREVLGFSRNAVGEFQPGSEKPTAEETATVRQAGEIRVDERRDQVGDMIVDSVEMMNDIIFKRWDGEQVVDLVGPGGAQVWVRVNPRDLRMGRYQVTLDPDSQVPMTKRERENRAGAIYNLLKTNPLIDPQRLTQYLLSELGGVQMDELMRSLPPTQTPSGVINPAQLAGLLQHSMSQAGAGNAVPALAAAAGGGQ